MHGKGKAFLIGFGLIIGGLAVFFLFLYLTGHDPDERPLTVLEWVLAGVLISPGVRYLIRWRQGRSR